MPSAFSYSKRDLDLSPGRVLPLEKIAPKIYNYPQWPASGRGIYICQWLNPTDFHWDFHHSIKLLGVHLLSFRRNHEMTQAGLGRNQIYEFQPNPEVEQRVYPWKVTGPSPKKVRIVFQAPFFRGELLTFGGCITSKCVQNWFAIHIDSHTLLLKE